MGRDESLPCGRADSRTISARSRSPGSRIVRHEPSSGDPGASATPSTLAASSLRSRPAGGVSRSPRSRLGLFAGGFVALFVCLLVFGAIAEDVHEQEANALDALATQLLHGLSNATLDGIMRALTNLGSTIVIASLFVVAFVLLLWRHRHEALFLAVSMAGSLVLDQSLKLIFHRPRPQLPWAQVQAEYSFPSGHAMNSFVFYLAVALIIWVLWDRRAGLIAVIVAMVVALLVGTSRIYLGYHYFTDVAGGFLVGAAWLLVVSAAFNGGPWLRRRRAEASPGP